MMLADDILLLYAKTTSYTSNLDKYTHLIYKQVHVLLITSSDNKRYSFAKKTRLESASDRTLQAGQSRKLSIYHLQ